MVSKEDFVKVWKDSSRESILNQFYYEYKTLQEEYNNWNELKEWLKSFQDYHIIQKGKCDNEFNYALVEEDINVLGDVLQKMQEIESRK